MSSITEILTQYINKSTIPDDEDPEVVILMGCVGSGKTTLRKSRFSSGYVVLDAGDLFVQLGQEEPSLFPGAAEGLLNKLGTLLAEMAITEHRNIVLEIVGDDRAKLNAIVMLMKDIGYLVNVQFVECEPNIAEQRSLGRKHSNISSFYSEPFHTQWLIDAATSAQSEQAH